GWSPQPLSSEMNAWPPVVVNDLNMNGGYFQKASEQIGATETNDFIYGELQNVLREQLYQGIGQVHDAIPLGNPPLSSIVRFNAKPPSTADLLALLGLPALPAGMNQQDLLNLLKLEAPLA